MPPRRRMYRRKPKRPVRRVYRRRKMYRKGGSHGFLRIIRKYPLYQLSNGTSGVAGTWSASSPSLLQFLTLGTPVPSGSGLPGTYDTPFCLKFRFTDVFSPTELTNLFDQYKILSAIVRFTFNNNMAPVGANVTSLPHISYIQDYDDNNVPSSPDSLRVS